MDNRINRIPRHLLAGALVLIGSVLATTPSLAATIEIVLDASGSMRGSAAAMSKMEAAKQAILSTVRAMNPNQEVALRVYGHRLPQEPKAASCEDTELVIPSQPLGQANFANALAGISPGGQTPIALSLKRAAADLSAVSGNEAVVILVSDGEETCGGDPVAVACNLAKRGVQLTVHTVGFRVAGGVQEQLRSIAYCTGGQYLQADTADELARSFQQIPEVDWAPKLGFNSFHLGGGVTNDDFDQGFMVSAHIDFGVIFRGEAFDDEIFDRIRLYPGLTYSSTTFGSSNLGVFAGGAELRYFQNVDLTGWYAGAGPYFHHFTYSGAGPDPQISTIGLVAVGGYNFERFLGVEARFDTAFREIAILATFRFGAGGP